METTFPGFSIEATSHCQDGRWPRWSWWIRGVENSSRYGVVGTDENGHGLYLYSFRADRSAVRQELIPATAFSLPDGTTRQQANAVIMEILQRLGWGNRRADGITQSSAPTLGFPTAASGFLRA